MRMGAWSMACVLRRQIEYYYYYYTLCIVTLYFHNSVVTFSIEHLILNFSITYDAKIVNYNASLKMVGKWQCYICSATPRLFSVIPYTFGQFSV